VERASCGASHQTSDGVLELAVLGGVDERIDTAVDQHQHHGEVVEPEGQQLQEKDEVSEYKFIVENEIKKS